MNAFGRSNEQCPFYSFGNWFGSNGKIALVQAKYISGLQDTRHAVIRGFCLPVFLMSQWNTATRD